LGGGQSLQGSQFDVSGLEAQRSALIQRAIANPYDQGALAAAVQGINQIDQRSAGVMQQYKQFQVQQQQLQQFQQVLQGLIKQLTAATAAAQGGAGGDPAALAKAAQGAAGGGAEGAKQA
jgi:hypothetical protein